ncbi:MAG: site-specific DNA-methyltransferase [Methanogenium sp.]
MQGVLKTFPDKLVNCVMTSPPYWSLRDYGVEGQLGLEPTFDEYINKLCDIFDEVKRVLRDDGTCWVNIGDTYSGNKEGKTDNKISDYLKGNTKNLHKKINGVLSKSLCMIPFRFAIEMVNRGWILRNVIIWHKPNCMPSSVKDRFTVDFEYLFFFVKSKKYYFETQYEKAKVGYNDLDFRPISNKDRKENSKIKTSATGASMNRQDKFIETRNKRTTWTINTKPFKEAHFAVYPEELCETPIKAGCPTNGIVLDPFFGAGTTGLVALKQGKQFIGIELNPEYIKIANKRLELFLKK